MPKQKTMLLRMKALSFAWGERGVKEVGFTNRGKRVDQYQRADNLPGVGYAWCMAFVQWCYKMAGRPLPTLTPSVGFFVDWARRAGFVVTSPRRGDIVCFNFDADNWPDHVGFVLKVPRFMPWIQTIEGNTSPDSRGSQADGGQVAVKRRFKSKRFIYVRVPGKVPVRRP